MRHTKIAVAAAALSVLALAGCSSSTTSSSPSSAPATTPAASTPAAAGTIVDVAVANPDLSTLVTALKAAGLTDTLSGTGPFTVFAPTNEAFAKLPAGVLDKLLLPANKDALTKILTYHVVAGKVAAADVKPGQVASVEGSKLTLGTTGGVTVDKATVVTADVAASNGVIHVIDSVLVPADVDVSML